eukprot:g15506.t1
MSDSKGESTEDGCYLTFDSASQGTLFTTWSKTKVEGAVAFIAPGKAVPGFKYKQKGGRAELMRPCGGVHVKNLYQGYGMFAKLCRDVDGTLFILDDSVQVYLSLVGGTVKLVETGSGHKFDGKEKAVAVIPKANDTFQVGKMEKGLFIRSGREAGNSVDLEVPSLKNEDFLLNILNVTPQLSN